MRIQEDRTILVVDDDELARATLQDVLEHEGFQALGAEDGFMATRIIRHESIDLVFLDYNMPGKNGIEVLHEIKVINDVLPVIMLTANSDLDIFQWALAGCSPT